MKRNRNMNEFASAKYMHRPSHRPKVFPDAEIKSFFLEQKQIQKIDRICKQMKFDNRSQFMRWLIDNIEEAA